jgi:hypothetical protein
MKQKILIKSNRIIKINKIKNQNKFKMNLINNNNRILIALNKNKILIKIPVQILTQIKIPHL